jgi:hypothetical protein
MVYGVRNSMVKTRAQSTCSIVCQRCCRTRTETFVGGSSELGSGVSAATNSDKRRALEDEVLGGEGTGRVMAAWDSLYPTDWSSVSVGCRGSSELDSMWPWSYPLWILGQKVEGRLGSEGGFDSGSTGLRGVGERDIVGSFGAGDPGEAVWRLGMKLTRAVHL